MSWSTEYQQATQWAGNLKNELLQSKKLAYLVFFGTSVTVLVGVLLFIIDPSIHSIFDGIWSAWGTMTHVGFGDVVPTSFFGRLLSAVLILFGLVLFATLTALISATLIGKNIEGFKVESDEKQILTELRNLQQRITLLEKHLSKQS